MEFPSHSDKEKALLGGELYREIKQLKVELDRLKENLELEENQ